MRDDFKQEIKELLARRVGQRCSNPNCRALTSGPHEDPSKAVNIGVAAHITAASPDGPRYESKLLSEERKSPENGIWLCQNCAKLVDNDPQRYTVELLVEWKRISEQVTRLEVENPGQVDSTFLKITDVKLIRFYSQCFDRPAFQDPFEREGSMEAFDKAIADTIIAINTGCLMARDGQILAQAKGKSYLANHKWRERMDVIVDLLRGLRSRYKDAVQTGEIYLGTERNGVQFYDIRNHELADWMDSTRTEIISVFSVICKEAGIPPLIFPRSFRGW